jgi:serine/threonine protein kinase/predicted negative regulator of RcsB-dependent stress response
MSAPFTDRNLTFGMLALHIGFVTREQLLDAMHVWMLDRRTALGKILRGRGLLTEDQCADLDGRVDADVQASLMSQTPSTQDVSPPTFSTTRVDSFPIPELIPPVSSIVATVSSIDANARFHRLRSHATGGLGEVFVALDRELNREVALKEIKDRFADQPDRRARFVREAEITGNLEHPGIVPVYGLGSYPDGRPFYAMRFVRGESMQEAIVRFHQADHDPHRDPVERSLALRDLLGRFVAVCNAIAYAHSRGVIHRDIKPHNVMFGEYSESLVVDWGLARLFGQSDGEHISVERPVLPNAENETLATAMGQVIGTPGYMSPEQAEGCLDRLGPPSDLFALGATLYALLTGRAPYSKADTLRQASRADVVPARQRKSSVPPALDAVCRKAMAKRPEDRYPTARALAEDVQRWLADEPVSVHREPVTERLRRMVKRHRTLTTALAVLLMTVTAALAVGLAAVNAEKDRTRAAKDETQKALDAETAALERSRTSEKSAAQQRQLALRTLSRVVSDIQSRLRGQPGQKELRKELLARALAGLKEVALAADTDVHVDRERIAVHQELGKIFLEFEEGGTAEARRQCEIALEIATRLVNADPEIVAVQHDVANCYQRLGDVSLQMGDTRAAGAAFQRFLQRSERLALFDPDGLVGQSALAIAYQRLGDIQMRIGKSKLALGYYRQSLQVTERLASAGHDGVQVQRELANGYNKLGEVQLRMGDTRSALASFQTSLKISERLALADPHSNFLQYDLASSSDKVGDVQTELGDITAALTAYQRSLQISEKLARADPGSAVAQRNLFVGHNKVGEVRALAGEARAALASFEKGLKVSEKLARTDPNNAEAQRDLAISHSLLGDAKMRLGNSKAALAEYQQSLAVRKRLTRADPDSAVARRDLAMIYGKLGDVHLRLQDFRTALDFYQQSLTQHERLAKADPGSALAQRDLLVSYNKLGDVHLRMQDRQSALTAYEQGLALSSKRAAANPENGEAQRDLFFCYFNLGKHAENSDKFDKAAQWYDRALEIPKRFARPKFFARDVALLESHPRRCRAVAAAIGDPKTALEQPEEVRTTALATACGALIRQKQAVKALAAADLLAANAKVAENLYEAACGYALCVPLAGTMAEKEKRAVRAVELLRQAVTRGLDDVAHVRENIDLDALRGREDFKKVLAELEAAAAKKTKMP